MTHLRVREYETSDFTEIELTDPVRIAREGEPVEQLALEHKLLGPAATVVDPEGRIVFCCGLHVMWKGTAILWSVFSPLARKYVHTWRVVQRLLDYCQDEAGFTRIQCDVDPRWADAVRFLLKLGFVCEGVMRRFGPGGIDKALYAKVRK